MKSIDLSSAFRLRKGVAVLCAGLSGCSSHELSQDTATSPEDQRRPIISSLAEPNNDHFVYTAEFRDGKLVSSAVLNPHPAQPSTWIPASARTKARLAADERRAKLDSLLDEDVASAEAGVIADRLVRVIVTFKETLVLPRFPSLRPEPRNSIDNQDVQWRNGELAKLIEATRTPEHDAHAAELEAYYGAKVKERFWLINGMAIDIPLSQLRALEQHPDVQFVEPTEKNSPPPTGTMLDIRTAENSDALLGFTGGFVALLDTGILASHIGLKRCTVSGETSCFDYVLDCVHGTSNFCTTGSNLDPIDHCDHGTGSAGEIIGITQEPHRGMAPVVLDSMKVYDDNICTLNHEAAQRGFEAATRWGDNAIVAEMQDFTGGSIGPISQAADAAFAANRMVIAPAGNRGPSAGSVTAPGSARKALAVGAIDALTRTLDPLSGRGPVDGRTKPDLVGMANVLVPSSASNGAYTDFSGTSAATPNVAALSMGIWNFLNRPSPGIVYAAMLALGDGPSDNIFGAGLPRFPGVNRLIASSKIVRELTVDVSINLPFSARTVDIAIWWPEGILHKDIDLYVVNPQGAVVDGSQGTGTVFEKLRIFPTSTGTWKIRLVPIEPFGTRTVYYAWSPQ